MSNKRFIEKIETIEQKFQEYNIELKDCSLDFFERHTVGSENFVKYKTFFKDKSHIIINCKYIEYTKNIKFELTYFDEFNSIENKKGSTIFWPSEEEEFGPYSRIFIQPTPGLYYLDYHYGKYMCNLSEVLHLLKQLMDICNIEKIESFINE